MSLRAAVVCLPLVACARAPGSPSIVLVSLDTFRADRLGCLGNPDGLTPNLDTFAADSVLFTSAWSQADLTSMSHASLFTSRYPSELSEVRPSFRLGPQPSTLAEVLAVYGYDTAAFTAGGHLSEGSGLERGFATWRAPGPGLASFWHTLPPALAWLDKRTSDQPFFLFVHSYDAHMPYLKPAPFGLAWAEPGYDGPGVPVVESPRGSSLVFDGVAFDAPQVLYRLEARGRTRDWDAEARATLADYAEDASLAPTPVDDEDLAYVRASYDGAIAYEDALFGTFLAALRTRGLYDDTVIVVFADHGEALGDDGRFGHGFSLADEALHVPLIVHAPHTTPRRVDAPVALLDVLPTLVGLAGAVPPAGVRGSSLVPWLVGEEGPAWDTLYAEGVARMIGVRRGGVQLTFSGMVADSPYLPALLADADLAGPAFSIDTDAPMSERPALRDALLAWRQSVPPIADAEALDPAQVEAMRAHGYWGAR